MSKLEDPAITVKQAMVVTTFPGASAWQVELEVTDVLEKSIRSMGDLDHVESRSMDDISLISGRIEQYGTISRITAELGISCAVKWQNVTQSSVTEPVPQPSMVM